MYIVFEGMDGSGTTTHSKELMKTLNLADPEQGVVWGCEPTKTPIGAFVREFFEGKHGARLPCWRAMTMLFQADREENLRFAQQFLRTGTCIISDRSWMSTLVYQSISAEQQGASFEEASDWICSLNEHMPVPDITIILDVPVDVALARKNKLPDLYERKEFQELVRKRYAEVAGDHIVRIDSNRPFEEVEKDVFRAVWKVRQG